MTAGFVLDSTVRYQSWAAVSMPGETDGKLVGPLGDYDGDGISNLVEYAFVGDARSGTSTHVLKGSVVEEGGNAYLEGEFHALSNDSELAYTVKVSDALLDWANVEIEFNGSTWISRNPNVVSVKSNEHEGESVWRILVRDEVVGTRRFMELLISD